MVTADPVPPRSPTDLFGDPNDDSNPLWFKKDLFLSANFDAESYIADLRTFVPFDTLRSQLHSHLSALKHELVELINKDYNDFVNLSTKLVDVDSAVARMRAPLSDLREKITAFRDSVEGSLISLKDGLRQRAEAADARKILESLLDTFHIVSKDLPFVENMEKRIQSASLLLDASLGHCFVDGLEHRDENVIYNCLRAYASIDNTSNAEEIFRTTIVAPLVQKIIFHSSSEFDSGSSGDVLEEDFQKIELHIEKECTFLLEISSRENSGLHVFDFLANSIVKEVLLAIQKGKPGAFSPGRPTEFLKNYKSSLDFLAHLEGYCPSRLAVSKFRSEPVYLEFMKQWNMGVYFSLRFQEIAGALDSALISPTLVVVQYSNSENRNAQALTLTQSVTLLASMRSCWSDDVLVISCSDKFLRLSLQLLSRYTNWLSSGLAGRKSGAAGAGSGSEWAISAAAEDFIYVIHDINCLVTEICGDYLGHVLQHLDSCPAEVQDLVKQSILLSGKSLKDQAPLVMKTITEALVEKSIEDLRQLRGITTTFRMTNKPLPVRHSPYVSGILRPLKVFLEGDKAATFLTPEMRNELLGGAASGITGRYYEIASEVVTLARKTENSLLRIRQGAQRRGAASSDVSDSNVSDTDKICMQLFLDIQEYGRNLSALGVDAAAIPTFQSLWQLVAPSDRRTTISF